MGGKDLYAGLWEKVAIANVAHHGMTAGTYQLKFDQLTQQGYQPRFVVGWAGEDPVDVVLRFTMQQQTQANWCWAATGRGLCPRWSDRRMRWCIPAPLTLSNRSDVVAVSGWPHQRRVR